MHIPLHITDGRIETQRIAPLNDMVTHLKITIPLYTSAERTCAPLYAELLMRGTTNKTREAFAEALESFGAELSVDSDRFGITITGVVMTAHLNKLCALLKDMLSAPAFAQKEIDSVHRQYRQYLHDEEDDARTRAYAALARTLYPASHPYHKPTIAARRAFLARLDRTQYLDMHEALRSRPAILTIVATEADTEKVLRTLRAVLTDAGENVVQNDTSSILHDAAQIYQTVPDKANVELYVGNLLPLTAEDAAFVPFQFGMQVLGAWGSFSGRLMSTVREKEGLTYTIYTRTDGVTAARTGSWYIYTFFTPRDLERGLASTKREIEKIVARGVTTAEVRRFQELNRNQFIIAHESAGKMLSLYHEGLCGGLSAEQLHARNRSMQQVRKKEADTALREYLDPRRLVISGAGPVTTDGTPLPS